MKEIEIKYGEARRRARLRWANSEHGKELSKNYMKEYRSRPHVKAKYHEYYIKNKAHWGEITKAKERKAKHMDRNLKETNKVFTLNTSTPHSLSIYLSIYLSFFPTTIKSILCYANIFAQILITVETISL